MSIWAQIDAIDYDTLGDDDIDWLVKQPDCLFVECDGSLDFIAFVDHHAMGVNVLLRLVA